MGEISDMILDGQLCERCGRYLRGDPPGYPRRCKECAKDSKGRTEERPQ